MPLRTLLVLFLVVVAAAGCSLVPDQTSCDLRPKRLACSELLTNRNNQLRTTLETLCTLSGGSFSESLCNHGGALGGCRCEGCENGVAIDWFFPGFVDDKGMTFQSVDDVKKACASLSRPFVAP